MSPSPDSMQRDSPSKLDLGTQLAYQRTFMSHERTEMSWVRTTLTFITFGFTISKFFESLRERNGEHATLFGPQSIGVLMIAMGLIAMAVATVYHATGVRELRRNCPDLPGSPIGVIAVLIFVLGAAALIGVLLR